LQNFATFHQNHSTRHVHVQVDQLQQDAAAAADDFASQIRQLDSDNAALKLQILQLQQQQSLQTASDSRNGASPNQQRQLDAMRSLEVAHAEQQKLSAMASAAQSECSRLQQQLASAASTTKAMQDAADHQQRLFEQQQLQTHELRLHVEEARMQASRATARASAAEAEVVRISAAAIEAAAAADREREEQQQHILHLQDVADEK
jgi:hypothetical protein